MTKLSTRWRGVILHDVNEPSETAVPANWSRSLVLSTPLLQAD